MGNTDEENNKSIEEIKEAWRQAPDSAILEALGDKWGNYSPEAQSVIFQEAENRGINVGDKQIFQATEVSEAVHKEKESKWLGTGIGFLCLILLYLGINGILWMFYEWRESKYIEKIERLDISLQNDAVALDTLEKEYLSQLEDLEKLPGDPNLIIEISSQMEIAELSGDPCKINMVRERIAENFELIEMVNITSEHAEKYEEKRLEYNKKVERYNKLLEKEFSRCYIIPIPGGRGK
jgi:hypothetical protein